MLHIKLTGMKHRAPCKQIFCLFTHSQSLDGVIMSKQLFSERRSCCISNLKERSEEHYASKMFNLMHTPDLLGLVKRSDIEIELVGLF